MRTGFRNLRWRLFVVSAAALLLTVQIGLVVHSSSHLHKAGETGDCHLCVLNSHFVAEPCAVLDLHLARPAVVFFPEESEVPVESILLVPASRGPPGAFV